jgi:hypothetical protein
MRAQPLFSVRAALGLVALGSATASAQLSNASTAATGLGGAFTARAQGYNAVYWNPANLAMPGNPGFSLSIGAVDGNAGIKPLDYTSLSKYFGKNVPHEVREQWLADIEKEGAERGDLFGAVTGIGLNIGRLGLQVAAKSVSQLDVAPGAMEALLFGNAGRDSTFHELPLDGSRIRSTAFSTAAVSYGMPFGLIPLPNFSLGFTGKFIKGQGVMVARDAGSAIDSLPDWLFPTVITNDSTRQDLTGAGSGFGLDIGAAWTIPGFRFGVSVQNVMNTFRWDTTTMELREATGYLNYGGNDATKGAPQAYDLAPADLREEVAGMRFKPVIAAGVAMDWIPTMTLSADIRQQVAGGIEVGPESLLAAGAEWRIIPLLPLRGGVQMMTGGFGISGGVGLRLMGFEAGLAGYLRNRNGSSESGATINVLSIRP